jgi:SNF2 family DNA or RNA helicase
MGTGKTLMGLLLAAIQPRGATPTLILCPKSAIFEWATSGVEKFFDESSKSCLIYHPDILRKRRFHSITIDEMCSYDYVVTTYETVSVAATKAGDLACGSSRSRAGIGIPDPIAGRAVDERVVGSLLLYSIQWHRILADEGHLFCNPKTARYRNVMNLRAPRRHVLTGTPFKNCSVDLWALLRFIGFTGVDSATRWEKEGLAVYGALGIDSNVLSIDLSQCPDITLPPCVSKTVVVTLSELERQVYYRLLLAAVQRADDTPTDTMNILAAIVRMRQAAISPHVFVCVDEGQTDPSEDDDGGEINKEAPDANKSGGGQCGDARKSRRKKAAAAEKAPMSLEEKMGRASSILSSRSLGEGLDGGSSDNDALVRWVVDRTGTAGHRSSKIRAARTIIADHADEKVVVFCNSLSSLVLLVEAVNSEADPQHKVACYISGAHNATKRNLIITKWKTDPTMRVLCMTYATGSVALNLTESHICIFLDPGWNRVGWDQGGCRVHRIGQTHSVTLYNIVVKDSVEQFLIDMCRYKGDLGNLFFAPANESEDELEARLANIKDRLRIGDVINLLRRAYGIAKLEQQQAALGGAAIYSAMAPTS